MLLPRRCAWILLVAACAPPGCSFLRPDLVAQEQFERLPTIESLAVIPFQAGIRLAPTLEEEPREDAIGAGEATALVTRLVTEAIAKRGVEVVAAHDVEIVLARGPELETEAARPEALALALGAEFGVHAVLLGELRRYRERGGSAYGSFSPASVEMVVSLYAAPSGEKLWVGRFDRTQPSMTQNLFEALRYPGGGTHFLSAAELAGFAAERLAEELPLRGH
jgi:hypothetical protein